MMKIILSKYRILTSNSTIENTITWSPFETWPLAFSKESFDSFSSDFFASSCADLPLLLLSTDGIAVLITN